MKSQSKLVIKRDIKTSMAMLLKSDKNLNLKNEITPNNYVFRQTGIKVCKQLQVLGWRFKTSLPIIKPLHFKILHFQQPADHLREIKESSFQLNNGCKSLNDQLASNILIQIVENNGKNKVYDLEIAIEQIKYRLSQLECLPFNQIIYLLKEMMIGYDVLMDIFGTFDPTDEMICLNEHFQWRLWISENYHLNKATSNLTQISQKQFIYKLIFIAEKHCNSTSLSKYFFQELKEFTYKKQCTFIKTLERIKEFVCLNKIFQVNRITLPSSRKQKAQGTVNDDILHAIPSPILMKKYSQNVESNKMGSSQLANNTKSQLNFSKSSSNLFQNVTPKHNFIHNPPAATFKANLDTSATFVGHNYNTATPKNNVSRIISPNINLNKYSSMNISSLKQINSSFNINMSSTNLNKTSLEHRNIQYNKRFSKFFQEKGKISQILQESNSYITKGRHQLKAIINSRNNNQTNNSFLSPQPCDQIGVKTDKKKKARKYSEQIQKYKSVYVQPINKKFSNIFMNDPENHGQINVIKKNQSYNKQNKRQQNQAACIYIYNNYDSSPSTKQIQKSRQSKYKKEDNQYGSIKQNDLGFKSRNNQSSYYGINEQPAFQEIKDKAMAVSFNFHNQNSPIEQKHSSSNWAKKISGLFSDDASIKQLKESVKFKTEEQKLFEKQYLKDVKLDLLQKFGRQVRHVIVDQDDDFQPNPYQSMQLIQQVLDEGKSFAQKEDMCEQQPETFVRKRNQTVQIVRNAVKVEQRLEYMNIKQIESHSVEYESNDASSNGDKCQAFNFEPQSYNLTKKM